MTSCWRTATTTQPRTRASSWPRPEHFNFALDWFDAVLAAENPDGVALRIIEDDGTDASYTFAELSERSDQVAGWLRAEGVARGMRVLVLLGNQVELWETTLAAMKLGAVLIPATTLLAPADLRDRVDRGHVGAVIAQSEIADRFADVPGGYLRIAVGEPVPGLAALRRHRDEPGRLQPGRADPGRRVAAAVLHLRHDGAAEAGRAHPHQLPDRAPVDDVLDRAAARRRAPERVEPGLGQARLVVRVRAVDRRRDDLPVQLRPLRRARRCSTCCATRRSRRSARRRRCGGCSSSRISPPGATISSLRELVGAGEPLNPEVIESVQRAWGITIRDGFGQTEIVAADRQLAGPAAQGRARWAGRCRASRSSWSTR